jgi:AcrR family transcriptional regulator
MNKGQYTKEMIIEKAAELFNTKGYAGCSLSDIMAATGLKKGGLYNHFSNKDEISLEAFKFSISRLEATLADVTRSAKTEKARLNAILEFYRNYAINPVIQGGCPILNTLVDADDTNPALIALARQKTEQLLKGLQGIIQRGQSGGEFQTQVEPRTVALIIFSGIEGALLLTRACEDEQAIDAMISCLNSYLENAVYV